MLVVIGYWWTSTSTWIGNVVMTSLNINMLTGDWMAAESSVMAMKSKKILLDQGIDALWLINLETYFTDVKFKIPTCEHRCFVFVFPHIIARWLDRHVCDRADRNHTMHERILRWNKWGKIHSSKQFRQEEYVRTLLVVLWRFQSFRGPKMIPKIEFSPIIPCCSNRRAMKDGLSLILPPVTYEA